MKTFFTADTHFDSKTVMSICRGQDTTRLSGMSIAGNWLVELARIRWGILTDDSLPG